jgi:MFS family permease
MIRQFLETKNNRWFVPIGAVAMQFALGAIYAWSVFTKALTNPEGPYAFSASETAWIFSVGLAVFAAVMIGAGKLLPKVGPRALTIVSALVLGSGYILGGFLGDTFWAQVFFIGVMGGAGIGFGYVVPIAVGVKWFPDKKGLVTGLAVAGFGFGATLWVKLAGSWLGLLETLHIAGLPGVQSTFIVYGIAFTLLVLVGAVFMVNPRNEWKPASMHAPVGASGAASPAKSSVQNLSAKEMLRTPQFYGVWTVFLFSALAGLMVIYSIKLFGVDTLGWTGTKETIAITTAGTAMAWYAIWNGIGRIAWGYVSDLIGRTWAVTLMVGIQGCIMLVVYHGFILQGHEMGLVVAASIIGFNFGGNFALMPTWTADLFGNKNLGSNYPWVFTAYGVAGICGPLLAGTFKDLASSGVTELYSSVSPMFYPLVDWFAQRSGGPVVWMAPFLIAGILCIIAATIPLFVRQPAQQPVVEDERSVVPERA